MGSKTRILLNGLIIGISVFILVKFLGYWDIMQPPEDISTDGYKIMDIFNYTTILITISFILVCVGLFGFAYLYDAKRHPKAQYTYGNKKEHIISATIIGLAVFLLIDLNITRMSNNHLIGTIWNFPDPKKEDVVRVEVLAQQWAWNFRYAGEDNLFNTADDIVTVNDLYVPKGKKLLFHITSKDVIHAFYVPNVRLKVDALPGRITRLWFDANKAGTYDIACAEMCGTHHYLMKAYMHVLEPEEFKTWTSEAQKIAYATNDPENLDLFWGWRWDLTK